MQRQYTCIVKMKGNVSDWLSYAGGALIKVADSAGSTVGTDQCAVQSGQHLCCSLPRIIFLDSSNPPVIHY